MIISLNVMHCDLFFEMWHLYHAETASLGELGSLVCTTRLHHLHPPGLTEVRTSIKIQSKGEDEGGGEEGGLFCVAASQNKMRTLALHSLGDNAGGCRSSSLHFLLQRALAPQP